MTKSFKFLFKLSISLGLIFWLFQSIDTKAIAKEASSIDFFLVLLALILIIIIRLVMALRWKILLSSFNIHSSYQQLVSIIFISNSIGHLLPGGIGTDIMRSYQLTKKEGMAEKIAASVFIDRIFGFISMIFVALISSIFATIAYNTNILIPIFIFIALTSLFVLYYFSKLLSKHKFPTIQKNSIIKRILTFYNKFISTLKNLKMSKHLLTYSMLLSTSVQIIRCYVFYILFQSLNADIGIIYPLIFIPIIFILMLLPISIGGLGVREASLFYFFGQFGILLSTCTLVGIIFHALQIFALLPGLFLYLKR